MTTWETVCSTLLWGLFAVFLPAWGGLLLGARWEKHRRGPKR